MNEAQIIYFDLLPDYTVSVLVKGCDEWDLLKSMSHLESWASSQFVSYALVFITNATYQEHVDLGVFDDYCNNFLKKFDEQPVHIDSLFYICSQGLTPLS